MPKALECGNDPPEAPRGATKASRGPFCRTCPRCAFALSADLAAADLEMISGAPEAPDTRLLAVSQLTFKGHPLISLLRETGVRRKRSGPFFAGPWGDRELCAPPPEPPSAERAHPAQSTSPTTRCSVAATPGCAQSKCGTGHPVQRVDPKTQGRCCELHLGPQRTGRGGGPGAQALGAARTSVSSGFPVEGAS